MLISRLLNELGYMLICRPLNELGYMLICRPLDELGGYMLISRRFPLSLIVECDVTITTLTLIVRPLLVVFCQTVTSPSPHLTLVIRLS